MHVGYAIWTCLRLGVSKQAVLQVQLKFHEYQHEDLWNLVSISCERLAEIYHKLHMFDSGNPAAPVALHNSLHGFTAEVASAAESGAVSFRVPAQPSPEAGRMAAVCHGHREWHLWLSGFPRSLGFLCPSMSLGFYTSSKFIIIFHDILHIIIVHHCTYRRSNFIRNGICICDIWWYMCIYA